VCPINSKNEKRDLYRGIKEFKMCFQLRINLAKDADCDLLADSHISNMWNNYFSQLLNGHNVSDVGQIEVHTAEPLVPVVLRLVYCCRVQQV
jgi:hypothetical protein